jgi:hypothetical protein
MPIEQSQDHDDRPTWNWDRRVTELWAGIRTRVQGEVQRPCTKLGRQVKLGIVSGLPTICLDTIPHLRGTTVCPEVCCRHVNLLAESIHLMGILVGDYAIDPALSRLVFDGLRPILRVGTDSELALFAETLEDGAPPPGLEEWVHGPRDYGRGNSFTHSGHYGRIFEVTEEMLDRVDTAAAEKTIADCLRNSAQTGKIHLFEPFMVAPSVCVDPRRISEIPKTANWFQALDGRAPALWLLSTPDMMGLTSCCINPQYQARDNLVSMDVAALSRMFLRSAVAMANVLAREGAGPEAVERIIAEGSAYMALGFTSKMTDVAERLKIGILTILGQLKISEQDRARIQKALEFDAYYIEVKKRLAQSYLDGQIHGYGIVADGLAVTFHTFPVGAARANEYFRTNFGGFEGFLLSIAEGKLAGVDGLMRVMPWSLLVSIVVLSDAPLQYRVRITVIGNKSQTAETWNAETPPSGFTFIYND